MRATRVCFLTCERTLVASVLLLLMTTIGSFFMFGLCGSASSTCSTDWDCCSFSCLSGKCAP